MHAGQAAAIGVHRQPAARRNAAVLHVGPALALFAEPQVFQEQQRVDGEGVVKLRHVHVGHVQAGHGQRALARFGRRRHGQVFHGRDLAVPHRGGAAQHVHGGLTQLPGAVGAHHHVGAAAIADQAAVAHGKRVRHGPRPQHVFNRQGLAHRGLGVHGRPGPRGHGHLGQLLARGAVLVHVTRGGQGVGGDRLQGRIRMLERLRIQQSACLDAFLAAEGSRLLRAAVADQHRIALSGDQRHHRGQQVRDKA
ncbi:hypothetical protein D3C85_898820 [compost metagenome]